MKSYRLYILMPFVAIAICLLYSWGKLFIEGYSPNWRHYLSVLMFVPVVYFVLKSDRHALLAIGVFLMLGVFHLLTFTYDLRTVTFGVGFVSLPPIEPLPFGILLLFLIFNFYRLVDIYLDYKKVPRK
jgi:hypothetical protein